MQDPIQNSIKILRNDEIILYPTDTVWGIGCDATSTIAVSKVFQIKKRNESKSLVVLVSSLKMLRSYIEKVPTKAKEIIRDIDRPITIIYNRPKGLAKNVIARDNTVAIRIVKDVFCKKMIQKFGKPIVSSSANISGKPTPKRFSEIESSILESVDYIVDLKKERVSRSPSMIVKITNEGVLEFLRK